MKRQTKTLRHINYEKIDEIKRGILDVDLLNKFQSRKFLLESRLRQLSLVLDNTELQLAINPNNSKSRMSIKLALAEALSFTFLVLYLFNKGISEPMYAEK